MADLGGPGQPEADPSRSWADVPEATHPGIATAAQGQTTDDAPLTPLQEAVVEQVTEGQAALGDEMRHERQARFAFGSRYGGGTIGAVFDDMLAMRDAGKVSESEDAAQLLAGLAGGSDEPIHCPAGGPPTPEEVHAAEMNPWPHHSMAETIERNRALRASTAVPEGAVPPIEDAVGPPTT